MRHGYDFSADMELENAPAPFEDEPIVARLLIDALAEKPPKGPILARLEDYLAQFVIAL